MTAHRLKCWPEFYRETKAGRKRAEVRLNDRDFKVGDWLILQEWDPATRFEPYVRGEVVGYTGDEVSVQVTHVLASSHLKAGHVMLSHGPPSATVAALCNQEEAEAILRAVQRTDKRGRTYWVDPDTGRRTLNPELVQ